MDCLWQIVKRNVDVHADELIWKPINVLKIYYVSPGRDIYSPLAEYRSKNKHRIISQKCV